MFSSDEYSSSPSPSPPGAPPAKRSRFGNSGLTTRDLAAPKRNRNEAVAGFTVRPHKDVYTRPQRVNLRTNRPPTPTFDGFTSSEDEEIQKAPSPKSPPAPKIGMAPRRTQVVARGSGGQSLKRPAPGQPTPPASSRNSTASRPSYSSRSTRDTGNSPRRNSIDSNFSQPVILPVGETPRTDVKNEKSSFSSETWSSTSSKNTTLNSLRSSGQASNTKLDAIEQRKQALLAQQRKRVQEKGGKGDKGKGKGMSKGDKGKGKGSKGKDGKGASKGGSSVTSQLLAKQKLKSSPQASNGSNVRKQASGGSGSSRTEPTPNRSASLSVRSSPMSTASVPKGSPASSISRSPSPSAARSTSSVSTVGVKGGVLCLENIHVRNLTIEAKKTKLEVQEKLNVYMTANNKKKKADEEASSVELTLHRITNSSARYIDRRNQLEASRTHLELHISQLESDEVSCREELEPVQEEARLAREAVDKELASMDLPPKHQNGLAEGAFIQKLKRGPMDYFRA